tara:strand:- start:1206 stop:1517 length:312 start_codon:yes stop_codon:yes gene_type:complete
MAFKMRGFPQHSTSLKQKKFVAKDGSVHTGQVSDYEREKEDKRYYYKVDGKATTKQGYLEAHKKGIGDPSSPNFTDGKGLQTNDPDVHGYKAAREKARAKLKK